MLTDANREEALVAHAPGREAPAVSSQVASVNGGSPTSSPRPRAGSADVGQIVDEGGTRTGHRPRLRRMAGLDGVRAMAVLAVIAFHTGFSWMPGGYYGVDAFFVLSGFLITTLLVTEWQGSGTIRLGRFWSNRARRLLPALFLLVAAIGVVLAVAPKVLATPHIISDALSTVFYASNWFSIHGGVSYFSTAAQPSPLLHTWSLAIEEQFYLVWPLVVLAVLRWAPARPRRPRPESAHRHLRTVRVLDGTHLVLLPSGPAAVDATWTRQRRLQILFGLAVAGALASALWMGHLAPSGYTTRAYYGTDTRAQALLVGAAIAIGVELWQGAAESKWFVGLARVLGLLGMAGAGILWSTMTQTSAYAFSGGFLLMSLAAGGVVLCAAVTARAPSVWLMEVWPLPQLGRISYGIYLWYWPVLLVMSPSRVHWSQYPLFFARVAVTVLIAALSAKLVEIPIRRGALTQWRSWVAAPAAAAVALSAILISTMFPATAATVSTKPPASLTPSTSTPTTGVALPGQPTNGAAPALSPGVPAGSTPPVAAGAAGAGKPIKVLLVGDSLAGSLGVGLATYDSNDNVQIVNEGIPGCSLSMAQEIKVLWYTLPPDRPCGSGNTLLDTWQHWIDEYNPDVVVYLARGETFDQEVDGSWQNLGEAGFDHYVENRYKDAIGVLGSKGAAVVLMTTPYYSSGVQPSGQPWPEDAPSRAQLDNTIIHQVATTQTKVTGHTVYVFDLGAMLSPSNQFASTVDGIPVRCSDGVHFTPSAGVFVGLQLLPDLAVLGEQHRAASPSGTWPGRLPASTPQWYTSLPC